MRHATKYLLAAGIVLSFAALVIGRRPSATTGGRASSDLPSTVDGRAAAAPVQQRSKMKSAPARPPAASPFVNMPADQGPYPTLHEDEEQDLLVSYYENRLQAETRQDESAGAHEATVREFFGTGGYAEAKVLKSVECKAETCKMVLRAPTHAAGLEPWVRGAPFRSGGWYYRSSDGSNTIAFVGMPGHPLPVAELGALAREYVAARGERRVVE